jgi:hypothetical protein
MQYLKKHYEKVILVVVLLAVAGSAFWLTNQVETVRTTLEEQLRQQIGGKQKELKPVDLAAATNAMSRLDSASALQLSGEHKTVNPVAWLKNASGLVRAGDKSHGLSIGKISPLNLSITYTGVVGTGDPYRYQFTVEKAFEKQAGKRRPLTTSLTEGTKNETFLLREVKPPKEASAEVVVEIAGDRVSLAKDKPYLKAMAYAVDFKSDTTGRDLPTKRQDETVSHNGTSYKIISISEAEVIIEAPNKTRSSLRSTTVK